jgi:hypothetical protein
VIRKVGAAVLGLFAYVACGRVGFTSIPAESTDADTTRCTGHDEDGDFIADGCDNCPTVPNVDQLDIEEVVNGAIADGVGDACDPRPTRAGDSIAFFDACTQANPEFVRFNATSFADDGMVLGSITGAGSAQLRFRPNLTRADMRFTVLASAAAGTQWAGFWYRNSGADRRASFASINRAIPAAAIADLDETPLAGSNRLSDSIVAAPTLLPGMEFQLVVDTARLTSTEDVLRLSATTPAVNGSVALDTTVGDITGDPFFEAYLLQVRLHYLILYASQP